MPAHARDITGQRFGLLTAILLAGRRVSAGVGYRTWECLCDCGKASVVLQGNLTSGSTVSCGCHRIAKRTKHGMKGEPEYLIWVAMRQRCMNPSNKDYRHYGGRGIQVCERWENFQCFIDDMGHRPSPKHSIERKDNSGNYEPSNCVWALKSNQANNKRSNHLLAFNGETHTLAQWASITGIPFPTVRDRARKKWPPQKILQSGKFWRGEILQQKPGSR